MKQNEMKKDPQNNGSDCISQYKYTSNDVSIQLRGTQPM